MRFLAHHKCTKLPDEEDWLLEECQKRGITCRW